MRSYFATASMPLGAVELATEGETVRRPQVQVFGQIGIVGPGGGARLGRRLAPLVAVLAVHRTRTVNTADLVRCLWTPDSEPPDARGAVRQHVARLRAAIGVVVPDVDPADIVRTELGGYRLSLDEVDCDADEFAALLAAAAEERSIEAYRQALAVAAGGPAYSTIADEPWCRAAADQLDDLVAGAADDLAALLLGAHRPDEAVAALADVFDRDPMRERTAHLLASALATEGRRDAALRCLHVHATQLRDGTGLEPAAAIRELETHLLGGLPLVSRPIAAADSAPQEERCVGRDTELAALADLQGRPDRQIVLLGGPAGMGKTLLVGAFTAGGGPTLRGHCDPSAPHPLGPLAQAVALFCRSAPQDQVELLTHALGPRDRFLLGIEPAEPAEFSGDDVARLAASIADGLGALAEREPVTLVIEDAHWIGPIGASLLRQVLEPHRRQRLVAIVTHRTEPGDVSAAGAGLLRRFGRAPGAHTVALGPLAPAAVFELVGAVLGAPSPQLAALIDGRSGGHPLLVRVLADQVRTGHDATQLPPEVAHFVADRLDQLSPQGRRGIELAAMIGFRFELDLLAGALEPDSRHRPDVAGEPLIAVLDELERAALVLASDHQSGEYGFRHQLFRDAVDAGLSDARRWHLHAAVAAALPSDAAPWVRARHLWLSGPLAGRVALDTYQAAAAALDARLAHDEAATHWSWAVNAHRTLRPEDRAERCALLVSHGEALSRAGDPSRAAVLDEAWQLATELRRPDLAARALLHLMPSKGVPATPLEERTATRVWPLVDELVHAGEVETAMDLAATAADALALVAVPSSVKALARRTVEEAASPAERSFRLTRLGRMLVDADDLAERVQTTDEARIASREHPDPLVAYRAQIQHVHSAVFAGRLDEATATLATAQALALQLKQPQLEFEVGLITGGLALARGDQASVVATIERLPGAPDPDDPLSGLLLTTRTVLGFMRGYDVGGAWEATGGIIALVDALAQQPETPLTLRFRAMWEAVIAHSAAWDGQTDVARRYLDAAVRRADLSEVRDYIWLIGLPLQGYLAWRLADPDLGASIHDLALPYVGWNTWNSAASCGPVQRGAGLAAAAAGRHAEAVERLDAAAASCRAWGMPGWEARTVLELAQVVADRAARPTATSRELLRRSAEVARSCGATLTESQARALLAA